MSQMYSDPSRESEPTALPNIETWYVCQSGEQCPVCCAESEEGDGRGVRHSIDHNGWYWQACFPGCLPDGDPMGPFATEAEAVADAQEGSN